MSPEANVDSSHLMSRAEGPVPVAATDLLGDAGGKLAHLLIMLWFRMHISAGREVLAGRWACPVPLAFIYLTLNE